MEGNGRELSDGGGAGGGVCRDSSSLTQVPACLPACPSVCRRHAHADSVCLFVCVCVCVCCVCVCVCVCVSSAPLQLPDDKDNPAKPVHRWLQHLGHFTAVVHTTADSSMPKPHVPLLARYAKSNTLQHLLKVRLLGGRTACQPASPILIGALNAGSMILAFTRPLAHAPSRPPTHPPFQGDSVSALGMHSAAAEAACKPPGRPRQRVGRLVPLTVPGLKETAWPAGNSHTVAGCRSWWWWWRRW